MTDRRWRAAVGLLTLLAVGRVLAFAAAFPFFNGIDEHLHFDVVQKYSRGFLPGPEEATFDAASARLILDHGSPEFLAAPGDDPRIVDRRSAAATMPPGSRAEQAALQALTHRVNIEADAPPTFYLFAGAWLRFGRALGLQGLQLLYWLRWINSLILAAAVIAAAAFLRKRYPDDGFLQLAPPALLAAWPNDLLYGVTPDAGSLALGALCFFGLVRIAEGRASIWHYAGTGLALGAAFLNKYTNVMLVAVALGVVALDVIRTLRAGRGAAGCVPALVLASAAAAPALWWLERNLRVVGSLSGQNRKIAWMRWTYLAPREMLAHPLVGLRGWPPFLRTLAKTFWQGEFAWHGQPTHVPAVDAVYAAASLVLLVLAASAWLGPSSRRRVALPTESVAWAICASSVLVLAAISLLFDYGVDQGPLSRAFPFFASGRLVAGALVPFAVLYCRGIERLWARAPSPAAPWGRWVTLAAVPLLGTATQLALAGSAFGSPWNWYHLN